MNQACKAGMSLSQPQAPERERLIPNQAALLEQTIFSLEEEFSFLLDRLHQVRTEETVAGTKENVKEAGFSCPLAEHLRIQTGRVQNVVNQIRYQLSILEL